MKKKVKWCLEVLVLRLYEKSISYPQKHGRVFPYHLPTDQRRTSRQDDVVHSSLLPQVLCARRRCHLSSAWGGWPCLRIDPGQSDLLLLHCFVQVACKKCQQGSLSASSCLQTEHNVEVLEGHRYTWFIGRKGARPPVSGSLLHVLQPPPSAVL